MTAVDPSRCSARSRSAGEPLAGTAQVSERWLLIEHPGPWAPKPLATFPPALGSALERACAQAGAVPLLIRRPGRHEVEGQTRWYAVDVVRGVAATGRWSGFADLEAVAAGLEGAFAAATDRVPELVLVCTHATRDACCAILGRPLVEAVSERWPEQAWECSHLAGHRFAGTLMVLPSGAVYGGLGPDAGAAAVAGERELSGGRIVVESLRGLSRWPQPVQAAQVWVMRESGARSFAEAEVRGSVDHGEAGWAVSVGLPREGREVTVTARRESLGVAPVSCGKEPEERFSWRVSPVAPPG